jgi:hypothetical protein
MKLKHAIYFLVSAQVTFGLMSCGSSTSDKVNNSEEFEQAQKESLKQQIVEVADNIPSPTEIPYLLQATGADFNESLVNSRTKADQYASRHDKAALNLGVYAADVGYLASYDKTQEAINYINNCKTLADNLGVIGAFDAELLKEFEANIGNKDSLSFLLDRTLKRTGEFLQDDNRNRLAALVLTGSFMEGLYISTGLIKSYPKDLLEDDQRNLVLTPIIQITLQQKKSVSELTKMLSTVEQTGPIETMVADLKRLETAYANLNIEDQIKNNKANLVLSDKNLVEITEIVEKVRQDITQ